MPNTFYSLIVDAIHEQNYNVIKFLCEHSEYTDRYVDDAYYPDCIPMNEITKDATITRLLFDNKVFDISKKYDNNELTPLQYAVINENAETVKILLELSANVNDVDDDGKTALHEASESGNIEIIKLLLEYGANVNIKDNSGFRPFEVASLKNDGAVIKLLKSWMFKQSGDDKLTEDYIDLLFYE